MTVPQKTDKQHYHRNAHVLPGICFSFILIYIYIYIQHQQVKDDKNLGKDDKTFQVTKVFDSHIFLKLSRKMRRSKTETLICRERFACGSMLFELRGVRDSVKSSSTCASTSYVSTRSLAISHASDTSRFHPKPSPKASPNGSAFVSYCHARTRLPRPPELNENHSLRIREQDLGSHEQGVVVLPSQKLLYFE